MMNTSYRPFQFQGVKCGTCGCLVGPMGHDCPKVKGVKILVRKRSNKQFKCGKIVASVIVT